MYALRYSRCDAEGISWTLRGIREDGSFYGDAVRHSKDENLRRGTSVSGQLSADETRRLADLIAVIQKQPPQLENGPSLGTLFERLSPGDVGMVRRLVDYRAGDESEGGRAFQELVRLLEPYVTRTILDRPPRYHQNEIG